MRGPLTMDDVEEVEFLSRTPDAHRDAAAILLSSAAWHLRQAGAVEESLDLYRRAVADGGACTIDARVQLAEALMDDGREDEAREVAVEFRRSAPGLVDLAAMAEVFELAGDLREAHRLVNIGVNRLQLDPDSEEGPAGSYEVDELLRARRRIRAALGLPPDDLDPPSD